MARWIGMLLVVLTVGLIFNAGAAQDTKKDKLDADAIFKKLDTNNDGVLSKDEFLKLAERFKNKEKAREKLTMAFDKIDPENKGLSKDQFRKYLETERKQDDKN